MWFAHSDILPAAMGAWWYGWMLTDVGQMDGLQHHIMFPNIGGEHKNEMHLTLNEHTRSATAASPATLSTAASHDDAAGTSATATITCKVPRFSALVALVTVAIASRSIIHLNSTSITQQTLLHNKSGIKIVNGSLPCSKISNTPTDKLM